MNYLAHGWRFVDRPYVMAGTAVPDWLNVVDRGNRARAVRARAALDDPDPVVAQVARGIVAHHRDDAWFHETDAFTRLTWALTARLRARAGAEADALRAGFLGHVLVELLLDAALAARDPARLAGYYAALESLDAERVAAAVSRLATRPIAHLAAFIPRFAAERFLWDYADDGKLCWRLGQVLRRVGLPPLPGWFAELLPEARADVAAARDELFAAPIPDEDATP